MNNNILAAQCPESDTFGTLTNGPVFHPPTRRPTEGAAGTYGLSPSPSSASGSGVDAASILGINTKIAATRSDAGFLQIDHAALARIERYRLQSVARQVMTGERVCYCLRRRLPGAEVVPVYHVPSTRSACYGQLMVCGSVWQCPVCAAKISERRRVELDQAITSWRAAAGAVVLVTYTFSHTVSESLWELAEAFLRAQRAMTSHRSYKRLREVYSVAHMVKALEVTWGRANGWHPHVHVLLFLERAADVPRLEHELYAAWSAAAGREGLTMDRVHGVKVQATAGAIADYVAKFGKQPARRPWGAEDELTKTHSKRGRGERYTPFDLLRWLADTGEAEAGDLFAHYVTYFKGRHQLQWSRGARVALGLGAEKPDEELANEIEQDGYVLALLSADDWRLVLRYDQRAQLLELARAGDSEVVVSFIDSLWFRACELLGESHV